MRSDNCKMLPARLYKYFSLEGECRERTRSVIADRKLWFGSVAAFNDPFECPIALSMDAPAETWRDVLGRPKPAPEKLDEVCRQLEAEVRHDAERIGMLCLSSRPDHVLMWSHYAAKHTGLCMGFASTAKPFAGAQEVEYSAHFPAISLFTSSEAERSRRILLVKAQCWQYEAEWRVFAPGVEPGLHPYEPGSLVSVILGCNMSESDRMEVSRWVAESGDPVEVLEARRHRTEFTIELNEQAV